MLRQKQIQQQPQQQYFYSELSYYSLFITGPVNMRKISDLLNVKSSSSSSSSAGPSLGKKARYDHPQVHYKYTDTELDQIARKTTTSNQMMQGASQQQAFPRGGDGISSSFKLSHLVNEASSSNNHSNKNNNNDSYNLYSYNTNMNAVQQANRYPRIEPNGAVLSYVPPTNDYAGGTDAGVSAEAGTAGKSGSWDGRATDNYLNFDNAQTKLPIPISIPTRNNRFILPMPPLQNNDQQLQPMNIHRNATESLEYMCPYCSTVFTRKSSCKRHIQHVHFKMRDFACAHCPKQYSDKRTLNKHLREKHRKNPTRVKTSRMYTVEYVNPKDPYSEVVDEGVEGNGNMPSSSNHSWKIRRYRCKACHKLFSTKSNVVRHYYSFHSALYKSDEEGLIEDKEQSYEEPS